MVTDHEPGLLTITPFCEKKKTLTQKQHRPPILQSSCTDPKGRKQFQPEYKHYYES